MCPSKSDRVWVDIPVIFPSTAGQMVADLSSVLQVAKADTGQGGVVFTKVVVPPAADASEISYLRLATAVYSALTSAGAPRADVVVAHPSCLDALRRNSGCPTRESPGDSLSPLVCSEGNTTSQTDCERVRIDSENKTKSEKTTGCSVSKPGSKGLPDQVSPVVPVGGTGYNFGVGSGADIFGRFDVVAVGGTFDRLHAGHRLLLTAAAWTTRQKLWIGVTGEVLLRRKNHASLISPFEERARAASAFARRVRPDLETVVVSELTNAAGAAGTDASIDAIVVSRETLASAEAINVARAKSGLRVLEIVTVDVLCGGEAKLSSSALREADSRTSALCGQDG